MTSQQPRSTIERLEEDATVAGYAAAGAVPALDIAAAVLLGLFVVPPLAILAVVVLAPLVLMALVVGLVAAVLTLPYLLVQHVRHHHGGHATVLAHRLRVAGGAVLDLAPHRIDAAARRLHHRG